MTPQRREPVYKHITRRERMSQQDSGAQLGAFFAGVVIGSLVGAWMQSVA